MGKCQHFRGTWLDCDLKIAATTLFYTLASTPIYRTRSLKHFNSSARDSSGRASSSHHVRDPASIRPSPQFSVGPLAICSRIMQLIPMYESSQASWRRLFYLCTLQRASGLGQQTIALVGVCIWCDDAPVEIWTLSATPIDTVHAALRPGEPPTHWCETISRGCRDDRLSCFLLTNIWFVMLW